VHKRDGHSESAITNTQMARTKQQQPIKQSKRLISKENKKLDREFTRFVEGIVNEKFKGRKFDSEGLVAMWEGAEAWMAYYGEASPEKKKQLMAAQISALEHSHDDMGKQAAEAQRRDYIMEQVDRVAQYCESIGLEDVYLARP
jgi:hypothetical protein